MTGGVSEAITSLSWLSALALVLLPALILLCLKIKSSKKDPAFAGTEGTLITNHDDDNNAANNSRQVFNTSSIRTTTSTTNSAIGARSDRKLPELPDANEEEEQNYASVHVDSDEDDNDEDDDDEDGAAGYASPSGIRSDALSSSVPRQRSNSTEMVANHPYAKVMKTKEHPYATVKNKRSKEVDANNAQRQLRLPSERDQRSEEDQPQVEDERVADHRHQIDEHEAHNRLVHPHINVNDDQQQAADEREEALPQQYFSGDSQDSSRTGYTHITVREPVAQLHLPPPPPPSNERNNYMAVSEASDGLYAAIEDNDDNLRGSNDNAGIGEEASPNESIHQNISNDDNTSNESRQTERNDDDDGVDGAKAMETLSKTSGAEDGEGPSSIEAMYAKVHKASKISSASAEDEELPVGASAMHPLSLASSLSEKQKSAPLAEEEQGDDYESVAPAANDGYERVQSNSGYETVAGNHVNAYETVGTGARDLDPPYAQILKDEEDEEYDLNYETIPNSARLPSDPGYERVQRPGREEMREQHISREQQEHESAVHSGGDLQEHFFV